MSHVTQPQERSYALHLRQLMALGLPLAGSQVAQFSLHMTDVIMMGWYGLEELAALVLAAGYWFIFFVFLAGVANAVMPIVATANERGERSTIRRATRMALWISVISAIVIYPVFLFSDAVLIAFKQDPEIAALARPYLIMTGIETLPALAIAVMRSYFSALERTRFVLIVILTAVVLNIFLNWVFIFGNLGVPAMGVIGSAIASFIVTTLSMLSFFIYAQIATPENDLFRRMHVPDWSMFRQLLRLGVPIGLTSVAEIGLFNAATLMMGWISTVALASHGIVLQISAVTFMVQMGLSQAATVRAGNALGRGDKKDLRKGALVAIWTSVALGLLTTALFVLFPAPLMGLYMAPDEPQKDLVLHIGVTLMFFAGLMQVSDGGQQVALGLLRGLHDTAAPMWYAAISYWCIGMPTCYLLGFTFDLGPSGIWLGFIFGLTVAWLLMLRRFWRLQARMV